ncbi:MAG: elongation factor P maturation arginine rhamnosyltransferase EarP [Burkholderiales bacterium]|nr:elongation factor P maturation arginine rhamnosyltransferase EarP [Burkholderiales bacterium]
MSQPARSWDIFCSVVDNFGDVGVCWRLSRQLTSECGCRVRLWIDDLHTFAKFAPDHIAHDAAIIDGVEVRHWSQPLPDVVPHEVVVEAFGCHLPESFLHAMAARGNAPIWLNLEYLSAEGWIEGCHGLSSRHGQLPLSRYFFFPGFSDKTGGLLREHQLITHSAAYQADAHAQAALWHRIGAKDEDVRDRLRLSLFAYENTALEALLNHWEHAAPRTLFVADGKPRVQLAHWLGQPFAIGTRLQRGNLTLIALPFLSQDDYDRLLWACDVNFVRGEDSFVRAQWAARPFVWHIYPQEEGVHFTKLDAFLRRFDQGATQDLADAYRAFSMAWNGAAGYDPVACWNVLESMKDKWNQQSINWRNQLAGHDDLVTQLVRFVDERSLPSD